MTVQERTQFHVLSFEGPDRYSFAGGIASRIVGLTDTLSQAGFETHLWFVGDPASAGYEQRGHLRYHRWCQWLSAHHPGGVYDGEENKRTDYASSLPPFLYGEILRPHLVAGGDATILAEEWHTVDAVLHLDGLLRRDGLRDRVKILWNANNTFGFDGIDWARLSRAAVITTVSRYMKHLMYALGVNPLVIPNGLGAEAFEEPDASAVLELRHRFRERQVLAKVARWDPDKQWLLAVEILAELKRRGQRPLLVARGGVEAHGAEVVGRAKVLGLRVAERRIAEPGARGLVQSLDGLGEADLVILQSHLDPCARRTLFRSASVVLANSGHEPFGLVGLEAMAAAGVACTGFSGEDYAVQGRNALVMQTANPREFVGLFDRLRRNPAEDSAMRRAGLETAREYAWPGVVERVLLPRLELTME